MESIRMASSRSAWSKLRNWAGCAACHVVASNQKLPPLRQAPTPSFEEIANRSNATEKSLQRFIASTHWDNKTIPMTMSDQLPTKEETRAVVRYILSLRRH
jgi:cytochrome c1